MNAIAQPATSYPGPVAVDQQLRDAPRDFVALRAVIPDALKVPSDWRSFATLGRIFLSIALCLAGLYALRPDFIMNGSLSGTLHVGWQIPAIFLMWCFYGLVLVGLFVVGHDCGHGSFSRRGWVNTLVGFLCMSPLANGFITWRLSHNHHHAFTQLRGQEVDWSANLVTAEELSHMSWGKHFFTRLGYALPFGLVLWIAVNTFRRAISLRKMVGQKRYLRERPRLIFSNVVMATVYLGLYLGWFLVAGFWGAIYFHGIPLFISFLVGALIITLGHANADSIIYEKEGWESLRAQLVTTQDIRLPRWVEWLICNINIHIPHHIDTRIPWYYLPKARELLQNELGAVYREEAFGLRHIAWWLHTPLLKAHQDHLQIQPN